jgi:phage terminase small subunit
MHVRVIARSLPRQKPQQALNLRSLLDTLADMPALKNPRHEAFARAYLELGIACEAYGAAGYRARAKASRNLRASPQHVNASRLLRQAKVAQRLLELAAMAANRNNVTVDSLLQELDEARSHAAGIGQPAAMVQATMGKARITGHIVNRSEAGKPGDFAGMDTAADVIKAAREELGDDIADMLESLSGGKESGEREGKRLDGLEPAGDVIEAQTKATPAKPNAAGSNKVQ